MNGVSKTEGQQKLFQGFQNLRKDGQTEAPTERKRVTIC